MPSEKGGVWKDNMKSVREMIGDYRAEVLNHDIDGTRASKIITELSVLLANVNEQIREALVLYNQKLANTLAVEKSAARAKILAEITPEYIDFKTKKDLKEEVVELIRGLKYYVNAKKDEWDINN